MSSKEVEVPSQRTSAASAKDIAKAEFVGNGYKNPMASTNSTINDK